jgi:hypothetical protein
MIRVFARKTKWTPTDELAFYGRPPLFIRGEKKDLLSMTRFRDRSEINDRNNIHAKRRPESPSEDHGPDEEE